MKRYISASKSAPLYHGTTWENAISILESNELRANKSNETETYGVSFTRNFDAAYSQVVFVIDQEKLSYNYKIYPIYREGVSGRDLAEERVPKTIQNIRRYIAEVRISHSIIVRRIFAELRSDNPNLLLDSKLDGYNEVYWANKFLETVDKYNIPCDDLCVKLKDRIQEWKRDHINKL